MARMNLSTLMGRVVSENMEPRIIDKEKTNGEEANVLLNFQIQCWDEEDQRHYRLPVAVWGIDMVTQCEEHMKFGDLVCVIGEIRYKHFPDGKGGFKKIFTAIKAIDIEFYGKKVKKPSFYHPVNKIQLIGNLVNSPADGEEGFVVAVDRKASSRDKKEADYVTLVLKDSSVVQENLSKGSAVYIEGKVMTVKKKEGIVHPRIVVGVSQIVGG